MRVRPSLVIPEEELDFTAVRARGPGGQNVNKVSTAVQLRFDVEASKALSPGDKERVLEFADQRITAQGTIVIRSDRFRSQARNRQDAKAKLRDLLAAALATRKPRKKTRPPRSAESRRLERKSRRGQLKRSRRMTEE